MLPVHTHAYESSVTLEATCGTDGVRTFTCPVEGCDQPTYTEVIPATGAHVYTDGLCACGAVDPEYVDEDPDANKDEVPSEDAEAPSEDDEILNEECIFYKFPFVGRYFRFFSNSA